MDTGMSMDRRKDEGNRIWLEWVDQTREALEALKRLKSDGQVGIGPFWPQKFDRRIEVLEAAASEQ